MNSAQCALFAAGLTLSLEASAAAATSADKCEVQKLKIAGSYATCRLKVEAKARQTGVAPDASKCQEKLGTRWQKAEERALPGACPTEDDAAEIRAVLDAASEEVAEQLAGPGSGCPAGLWDRQPHEVVEDTIAALNAGDADLLGCNYHEDAFLIADQGVLVGRAEIVSYLLQFPTLFGAPIGVHHTDVYRDVVRILYEIDGGWVIVRDGSDAFQVQRGRIRHQSQHALIEFTGPPPD